MASTQKCVSRAVKHPRAVRKNAYFGDNRLKRFDKTVLPVAYYSQKNSWMTGELMEAILTKLNSRLAHTNRRILLLMDNAGCHPPHLNITICFLPANNTSKLQPLDLGIIKDFKVQYCTLLLKYIVAKMDEYNSASEVVKSVNILVAIRWVAQAWEKVKASTIQKCFRRAGILNDDMSDVVTCEVEDDPLQDLDENTNLQEVFQQVMLPDTCSV